MSTYLIVIILYFTLTTIVSVFTKKMAGRSAADYLIAGRNLGLIACSVVVAALGSIPYLPGNEWFWAVLFSALVITIYTNIGGMHALAITGIIHVAVMFLGLGIATISGINDLEGFSVLHQTNSMIINQFAHKYKQISK